MNHIYKTVWSTVHKQYVVTSEKQTARTKSKTSALTKTLSFALMTLMAGSAAAAYSEAGQLNNPESWKTPEYTADWGLDAMHAADAYALGFNGEGARVGMMDTGALATHPEFTPERFTYVEYEDGYFSSTGNRYPVPGADTFGNGAYKIGQKYIDALKNPDGMASDGTFDKITDAWIPNVNDSHGTHVVGSIAAARDGNGMHGVAYAADVVVANNGGLDNSNYGPYQDYAWYKQAYSAMVADPATAPKFINSSWGTNARINVEMADAEGNLTGTVKTISLPVNDTKQTEYEYFLFNNHARANWAAAEQYNATAQNKVEIPANRLTSFVDGMYEAVKDTDTIHLITTGNRVYKQPYYRANYPYYHPEAEDHWTAVGGLQQLDKDHPDQFTNISAFNAPGEAKWWSVVAPGRAIYSTTVWDDDYYNPEGGKMGDAGYDTWSGTSMANPHATGALGVLLSRYKDMTPVQVRDTMFSTANHRNPDGSIMTGWSAAEGTPDPLFGWGVPDLKKGMYGPAQLLREFDYALTGHDVWSNDISQTGHDARIAEDAKWVEEVYKPWKQKIGIAEGTQITQSEADTLASTKAADFDGEFILGDKFPLLAQSASKVQTDGAEPMDFELIGGYKEVELSAQEKSDYEAAHPGASAPETRLVAVKDPYQEIALNDAILWRDMAFEARKAAIDARAAHPELGLTLTENGTLVMTGHNTYRGQTTVNQGTLLAFVESVDGRDGEARTVNVGQGATFGLLNTFEDDMTAKGTLKSDHTADTLLEITGDGSLYVSGFADVSAKRISLTDKTIRVGTSLGSDPEKIAQAYVDGLKSADKSARAGSITVAEGDLKGYSVVEDNSVGQDNTPAASLMMLAAMPAASTTPTDAPLLTISGSTLESDGKTMRLTATVTNTLDNIVQPASENEKAVLAAVQSSANPFLGKAVALSMANGAAAGQSIAAMLKPLSSETVALARNVLVDSHMNALSSVLDAAHDSIAGAVDQKSGVRVWLDGSLTRGHAKGSDGRFKTSFDNLIVGADYAATDTLTLGAFAGYGHDKATRDGTKVSSDDLHAGIYAKAGLGSAELTAVLSMTGADRTVSAPVYGEDPEGDATVYNAYAEAVFPLALNDSFTLKPYAGLGYMHVKSDAMSTTIDGEGVTFDATSSDIGYGKVGTRMSGLVYSGAADVSVTGDIGYTRFFGDREAEQAISFGEGATAVIGSKKLGGLFNVGLGVNAQFTRTLEGELSYRGAFGSAYRENGVFATVKLHF